MIASCCSRDKTIKLSELSSGKLLRTFESDADDVIFSMDGLMIAIIYSKVIKLRDVNSGKLLKTLSDDTNVEVMKFSRDGSKILACSDYIIKLSDVSSGKCLKTFDFKEHLIKSIIISPDCSKIAVNYKTFDFHCFRVFVLVN